MSGNFHSLVYTNMLLWPFTMDLQTSYFMMNCSKTVPRLVPVDTYRAKAKGLVKSFLLDKKWAGGSDNRRQPLASGSLLGVADIYAECMSSMAHKKLQ